MSVIDRFPHSTAELRRVKAVQFGVLSPDEIHKLARTTRTAMGGSEGRASCHSDYVEPSHAKRLQDRELITLRRKPSAAPPAE